MFKFDDDFMQMELEGKYEKYQKQEASKMAENPVLNHKPFSKTCLFPSGNSAFVSNLCSLPRPRRPASSLSPSQQQVACNKAANNRRVSPCELIMQCLGEFCSISATSLSQSKQAADEDDDSKKNN